MAFGVQKPADPLSDPNELAGPAPAAALDWTEIEQRMAIQIATKASEALDLDIHLQERAEEYEALTQESVQLLSLRNYDQLAYLQYAREVPRLPA